MMEKTSGGIAMGREFELKYAANPEKLAALKGRFSNLTQIRMQTTYYDTPDGQLGKLRWTFRRRMENDRSVCTLKTPAEGFGRNEWETECGDKSEAVELLIAEGAPKQLLLFAAQGFVESCGASFTRLAGLVTFEDALLELALDEGVLLGGGRELPLCEVEVELKDGEDVMATIFASMLAEEFRLVREEKSKFARALMLAMGG